MDLILNLLAGARVLAYSASCN